MTDHSGFKALTKIDMNSKAIESLPAPSADNDAVRKIYIDDKTVTRSIWLPASVFKIGYGSPTEGMTGPASYDKMPYWALDDTVREEVGTNWYCPANVTGNVKYEMFICMAGANVSKVVSLRFYWTHIAEGNQVDTARTEAGYVVSIPDTALELAIKSAEIASAGKTGKIWRVAAGRWSHQPADTAAGDLWFLGYRISWTEKIMNNQ